MSPIQARVEQIRYNAAEECYEALVVNETPEGVERIACRFAAPMDAPEEFVRGGLIATASMARTQPDPLLSRTPAAAVDRSAFRALTDHLPFAA